MTRAQTPSRDNPQTKRHQAFTTIELMVVIAILMVLAGLIYAGMKFLGGSSKGNATRVTLGNLQGMLADLETASGLKKMPGEWIWTVNDSSIQRVSANSASPSYAGFAVDFWRLPQRVGGTAAGTFAAMASPGLVTDDGIALAQNQRHGSIAVVNTCLAMSMMAALPDNRSRLQSLPQTQLFVPEWHSGPIALPGGTAPLQYVPGAHVKYQGYQFVASPTYPAGNPAPVPGASGAWIDETAAQNPAPLLLDGWNNPIIFVPATGLRVRLLNGKTALDPADATQNFVIVSPEGEVINNGTATPTVARAGRPFFASAGADGDFSAGDDNIYSFEK